MYFVCGFFFFKWWCWRAVLSPCVIGLHAFYTTIKNITLLTGVRVTMQLSSHSDLTTKPPWLWKDKASWLLQEGSPLPPALLQVLLEMGVALLCHFFLQSTLEMKVEGVHSPASFSFSPSARVCGGYVRVSTPCASHFFWGMVYYWISQCDRSECFCSCFAKHMRYPYRFSLGIFFACNPLDSWELRLLYHMALSQEVCISWGTLLLQVSPSVPRWRTCCHW